MTLYRIEAVRAAHRTRLLGMSADPERAAALAKAEQFALGSKWTVRVREQDQLVPLPSPKPEPAMQAWPQPPTKEGSS